MVLKTRDYSSEKDYKHYDTARLREEYVVEDVFGVDDIHLTYSYIDRIIFGGVIPVNEEVVLGSAPELRAEHFLDRREMGVINIGGDGFITVDGTRYDVKHWEALYIGRGAKEVKFASLDKKYLLRLREEPYGYCALTDQQAFYRENYPGMVMEKAGLDEVIRMMVKGDRV